MFSPHPDSLRLEAVRLHRSGHSSRQIASRLGVGRTTIQRWIRAAPVEPPRGTAELEPEPLDSARDMLSSVVASAAALTDDAMSNGDMAAAQRSVVDLRDGAEALQRLDADLAIDGVRLTMREIEAEMAGIYARARAIASVPAICPRCGVELTCDLPDPALSAPAPALPSPAESPAGPRAREAFERSAAVVGAAKADGNIRAAQRANRAALGAAKVISRIERDERAAREEETHLIPRELIDEGLAGIGATARALTGVPLTCPPCGVALRMAAVGAAAPGSARPGGA